MSILDAAFHCPPINHTTNAVRHIKGDTVQVLLYFFKVDDRFAEECGTRYVVRAHRFGTPQSKWFCAESIIEVYDRTRDAFQLDWGDVEEKLAAKGGLEHELEMEEFQFARLFSI